MTGRRSPHWLLFLGLAAAVVAVERLLAQATEMQGSIGFLLTSDEECDSRLVFDLELLSQRLALAASWASDDAELGDLPMGLFGASTGAAAALIAAACWQGCARCFGA